MPMRSPLTAFRKRASDDDSTVATVSTTSSSSSRRSPMTLFRKRLSDTDDSTESSVSSAAPPAPKRGVRFAEDTNQVYFVECLDEMDESTIFETWYEERDYQAVKARLIPVIRQMMRGEPPKESEEQTLRGLEFRTREGAKARQENKADAIDAVVDEQERQRINRLHDAKLIADAYREVTLECAAQARELGLQDEAAIKDDLVRMRRETKKSRKMSSVAPKSSQGKSKGVNSLLKTVRFGKRSKSKEMRFQNAIAT